jgi:hypothetical protein
MGRFEENFLDAIDDGHQVVLEHERVDTPLALVWRICGCCRGWDVFFVEFAQTVLPG